MAACSRMLQTGWQTAAAATSSRQAVVATSVLLAPKAWQRSSAVNVVAKKGSNKSKAPNKADLPSKVCIACGRPFTWRKKWELVWDDVKYCSDRCRASRPKGTRSLTDPS